MNKPPVFFLWFCPFSCLSFQVYCTVCGSCYTRQLNQNIWWSGPWLGFLFCFVWGSPGVFFFNIYLFLRERQSVSRGGVEREADTESQAGSRPWAVSTEPDVGLELKDCEITTWSRTLNWLSHSGTPNIFRFLKNHHKNSVISLSERPRDQGTGFYKEQGIQSQ